MLLQQEYQILARKYSYNAQDKDDLLKEDDVEV